MGELLVHPNRKEKEMTDENIIPNGSLVEVIAADSLGEGSGNQVYSRQKFIVDDYAPFTDDPDYYSEVYSGYTPEHSWVAARKDNVRLVKTAEQMRKRQYPDARTLLKDLDLLGGMGDFEYNESEIVDDDTIELYGVTPDGLRFGVQLKVASIFSVDF